MSRRPAAADALLQLVVMAGAVWYSLPGHTRQRTVMGVWRSVARAGWSVSIAAGHLAVEAEEQYEKARLG